MNILFKLKHYLSLYFRSSQNYAFIQGNGELSKHYWIKGYASNIDTKKWEIEDGIPLGLYNGKLKAPLVQRVHIAGLCEYCFALTEKGRETEQKKVVNFLLEYLGQEQLAQDIAYAYWKTYKDNTLSEYYVHGMGQGQLLSMLTRYSLFVSKEASTALNVMLIKISNSYLVPFEDPHGFVNKIGDAIIFEEYPKTQDLTSHVLNGWMYSLIGLHDYLAYAKKMNLEDVFFDKKQGLFRSSVESLVKKLPSYDIGYWSLYNLPKSTKNICSIHYQEQHIVLLAAMYALTNERLFKQYGDKFKKQYSRILNRVLSLFVKVFIANLWKYKRVYKTT